MLGDSEGAPLIPISLANGSLETPVKISRGFDDSVLAITPNGQTAYVGQDVTDSVVPVDLATGMNGSLINLGEQWPQAIAVAPNGATAYVLTWDQSLDDGYVVPIDTSTNVPGPAIKAGLSPVAIAITPNGQTAYVVNEITDSLTPLDLATDKPESPISPITSPFTGSYLAGIAITPDGSTAYVINQQFLGKTPNEVIPVDLADGKAGTPITLGGSPQGAPLSIAIAPNGLSAYVTDPTPSSGHGSTVIPIDLTTHTAGAPIAPDYPGGSRAISEPWDVAISPDSRFAYVADQAAGWVIPINMATNKAEPPIRTGYKSAAVAVAPDQAPVAAFSGQLARPGLSFTFNASASTSSTSPIATYQWEFGDGTGLTTDSPVVQHTYTRPGRFVVTLTLTDEAGTSVAQVFTGQTMSNNGGPQARAERVFVIKGRSVSALPTTSFG